MMTSVATAPRPPEREKLSREEKKAKTRARLLDAAAVVFARKGFAGASLEDVAEEAGLTKGAVYSNFDSKDDLISALLDVRLEQPLIEIPDLIPHEGSTAEQALRADRYVTSLWEREREALLLGLEFSVYIARNPEVAPRFARRWEERHAAMSAEIAQRAAEAGTELPLPADELTAGLFALTQGIGLERLINPDHVPDGLLGRMLALIFR
jgi:AcrR family transcriptional regulator